MSNTNIITTQMIQAGYEVIQKAASDAGYGFYFSMAPEAEVKQVLTEVYIAMNNAETANN